MSEVNPVLDEFFPILIENFIRFETASLYVRSREAGTGTPPAAKFKIAPEYYNRIINNEITAPLIGLKLSYDGLVNLDGRADALFYGTLRKQDYERCCP